MNEREADRELLDREGAEASEDWERASAELEELRAALIEAREWARWCYRALRDGTARRSAGEVPAWLLEEPGHVGPAGTGTESAPQAILGRLPNVFELWDDFDNAETPVTQAGALVDFSNALAHLRWAFDGNLDEPG